MSHASRLRVLSTLLCSRASIAVLASALGGCSWFMPFNPPPKSIDVAAPFPIQHYDQTVDHWIDPASPDYDRPLLSAANQRAQYDALLSRYFGTAAQDPSPWNPQFINSAVYRTGGQDIADLQRRRVGHFDNRLQEPRHRGYGQNLREHDIEWIDAIQANMNIAQFTRAPGYAAARRAIATDNALVRGLPTADPFFYDSKIAGEGYPFDNLQISAIRPGTPLYVLGTSVDGAWRYVQTTEVQGWVSSKDIGWTDDAFVVRWRAAAYRSLGAVVGASVPVADTNGSFRFAAVAGTLLPIVSRDASGTEALVPVADADQHAQIRTARLAAGDASIVPVPWAATPRHFATLLKALIGRPYGWGNTGFYNDCSSELQSIYAAFGVWLPRHSSNQMTAGTHVDLSARTPAERLAWLAAHGAPLRTIIYIGGHVMLYLGNTKQEDQLIPVVYQDIWGLRPVANTRRAIIGGSVIMPLTLEIPEDPELRSLAAGPIFEVTTIEGPIPPGFNPESGDDPAS
ncbi:SH3 domain-containing C40 family peptidase [Pararobbsia silviterrae]|uniref:Hydrolase n=1 Tax=Pararobbsia silviterrae TaxID=1792498 RepID=A0A494XZB0_9BURK|nr:SH3 domain-containing C40 family peptidase [Pararobbsia silviterrae]RKP53504.1 hydrolase [Pararobbsia silviterrae]